MDSCMEWSEGDNHSIFLSYSLQVNVRAKQIQKSDNTNRLNPSGWLGFVTEVRDLTTQTESTSYSNTNIVIYMWIASAFSSAS